MKMHMPRIIIFNESYFLTLGARMGPTKTMVRGLMTASRKTEKKAGMSRKCFMYRGRKVWFMPNMNQKPM